MDACFLDFSTATVPFSIPPSASTPVFPFTPAILVDVSGDLAVLLTCAFLMESKARHLLCACQASFLPSGPLLHRHLCPRPSHHDLRSGLLWLPVAPSPTSAWSPPLLGPQGAAPVCARHSPESTKGLALAGAFFKVPTVAGSLPSFRS